MYLPKKRQMRMVLAILVIFQGFHLANGAINARSTAVHEVPQDRVYLAPGYYAVVGVFKFEKNAQKFTGYVKSKGEAVVEYAYYPPKEYYYVHVGNFPDYAQTRSKVLALRPDPDYEEAWVFKAEPYDLEQPVTSSLVPVVKDTQPEPVSVVAEEQDENLPLETGTEDEEPNESRDVKTDEGTKDITDEEIDDVGNEELQIDAIPASLTQPEEELGPGIRIYFNAYRARTYKEVTGDVEIINPERSQRITKLETHNVKVLPENINRSGDVQLICNIFGYKKVQHDLNLNDPINDETSSFVTFDEKTMVVDFALSRYTKGDLVTMYNVYFYKDAAIMRPESKYELSQLLEMLQENANYRIKIHGHTNGNASGPIIYRGDGDRAFFARSSDSKEAWGSAKKLSTVRAETITDYLIAQGISADRMEAKGWGGKKGVYDKLDNLAYLNVRVEVEILDDGT